jgi:hypothetical protein
MFSSKTYIVSWDEEFPNSLDIEAQLRDSGLAYLFHNVSSHDVDSPNWSRAEEIRYFGHFYNSLKDFADSTHSVFIFHAGDVVYDDLSGYTKKVEQLFKNDPEIALLAPNFSRDAFDGDGSFLFESEMYPGLALATMTNGMWVAISREIALLTLGFYEWAMTRGVIQFPAMRSGWGLDIVYASISILSNKKIYRDTTTSFYHPPGTSYDGGHAGKEMIKVINGFYDFAPRIGFKKSDAIAVHETIIRKVQQRENYTPTLDEVYPNLSFGMEF